MPSRRPRSATRSLSAGQSFENGIENGTAGEHEVGTFAADARLHDALLVGLAEKAGGHVVDIGHVQPDAVDALPIVAFQSEEHAGNRRDGARRSKEMHRSSGEAFAKAVQRLERLRAAG